MFFCRPIKSEKGNLFLAKIKLFDGHSFSLFFSKALSRKPMFF